MQAVLIANKHVLPVSRILSINSECFTYNSVYALPPGDTLFLLSQRGSCDPFLGCLGWLLEGSLCFLAFLVALVLHLDTTLNLLWSLVGRVSIGFQEWEGP